METKSKQSVTHLPVVMECWNCTNPAPTWPNGTFRFLAIKPEWDEKIPGKLIYHDDEQIVGEIRQICRECFGRGDMETSLGTVKVVAQLKDGTVELKNGQFTDDVCGCGMPTTVCFTEDCL